MPDTGFLKGAQSGIDKAIPLIIQKRRLEQQSNQFDQSMQMQAARLKLSADAASREIAEDNLQKELMATLGEIESQAPAGVRPDLEFGELASMGFSPENIDKIMDAQSKQTPEEVLRDKITLQEAKSKGEPIKGQSSLGKLQADVSAGLITEEQASKAFEEKAAGVKYSPSPLFKLIAEREALLESLPSDHPDIKAYDDKISGTDIDIDEMSQNEVDVMGAYFNLTGKMPSLGRGKQSTKIRVKIVKSAARQALGADGSDVPEGTPKQTPSDAALAVVASQADTRAVQTSLNFLDKQQSAMGSFVRNIGYQVDKVRELSDDLKTFDTRLMNVPLRAVRGRIVGSPLQAKYDMYLTEIEGEIGKLATGSSASIAELSVGAQEKWAKIHDKNLSVKDMLSLLDETRAAADYRMKSVKVEYDYARERMRTRDFNRREEEAQDNDPLGIRE